MQEDFVEINGVPTCIITWGAWVEDDLSRYKEIALCIPGNPGLPSFYRTFLTEVHQKIGQDIPVWILGYAGHDEPSKHSQKKVPGIKGNENLYDLKGQMKHIKEFIRKYIPENTKIHFIAHSTGSYLVLNLLDDPEIKKRAQYNYLLFPTIEKMAETKNGKYLLNVTKPLIKVLEFLLLLLNLLPEKVKYVFLYLYCLLFNFPKDYLDPLITYLKKPITLKVYLLAIDKMVSVRDLNLSQVANNLQITKYYYGLNDQWAPIEYFLNLKKRFPNINAELCSRNIDHAFVLRSSKEMATLVASWIMENKCKFLIE